MNKKVKIFAIVVIVIALVIWAVTTLGGPKTETVTPINPGSALTTTAGVRPAGPMPMGGSQQPVAGGSEFSTLLSSVNSINIDTSIFTNPAYKTLRDYPVSLGTDTIGRTNPFAPIGSDQAAGTTTSSLEVQTLQPGKITATRAELGAQVTIPDTVPVSVVFNYGLTDTFGSATTPVTLTKSGTALVTITGLTPATQYLVKAVVVRGSVTTEGEILPFTTASVTP